MTEAEVLFPGGGGPSSMHEKRLPRVKLEDGTLGVPAEALDSFQVPSA